MEFKKFTGSDDPLKIAMQALNGAYGGFVLVCVPVNGQPEMYCPPHVHKIDALKMLNAGAIGVLQSMDAKDYPHGDIPKKDKTKFCKSPTCSAPLVDGKCPECK